MADRDPTKLGRIVLWGSWLLILAAWTALLLSPRAPGVVASIIPEALRFWVAKGAHVSAYALLSVLTGCLPVRWGVRLCCWLVLVGHGALTEYLQLYVPGRTGSLRDVGLDVGGIVLGLLVLMAWRRRRRA
jgi:VanZ family protein